MNRYKKARSSGLSLLELLVALALVSIIIGIAIGLSSSLMNVTKENRDLAFASRKVLQIINELNSYVESGREQQAGALDKFNEASPSPVLTIYNVPPDHPLSGNIRGKGPGGWYYYKQIVVQPLDRPHDPHARLITIHFYRAKYGNTPKKILSASAVIRSLAESTPPKQVYDVYLLAISNSPGWWVRTSELRNVVDGAIKEIMTRNPNLDINAHWITVMGYGRDPYYKPFIAEDFETNPSGLPGEATMVYYYLGTSFVYTNASGKISYYTTPFFKGKLNAVIDGTLEILNPNSFSIADQYNHCVRYPEAVRIYQAQVKQATDNGLPKPELTYRLLLENLYFDAKMKNPIVINLHGEMIPLPPMRNYSDPVRRPDESSLRGVRVVAHPERIAFPNGSNVALRVYAFYTNPDNPYSPQPHHRLSAITLIIGPVSDSTSISYWAIDGGVERVPGSSGTYDEDNYVRYLSSNMRESYCPSGLPSGTKCTPGGMGIRLKKEMINLKTYYVVTLYNTPLKVPYKGATGKGLPSSYRLLGLEYVPTPLGNSTNPFSVDLTYVNSGSSAVNTARWRIVLSDVPLSPSREDPLEILYTIGDYFDSPLAAYQLPRPFADRSYAWIGYSLDGSGGLPEIPITEQYQYQGDRRLNPYADVKYAHNYNWYSPLRSGDRSWSDWGWRRSDNFNWQGADSWRGIPVDIPAFFATIRRAFQRSRAVYTSMTGFSYYYVSLGGEIGGDAANQVRYGPPVNDKLYGGSGSGYVYEKAITQDGYNAPSQRGIKNVIDTTGDWDRAAWGKYALTFLGELYPDSMWDYWKEHGNLPTPRFQRRRWRDSLPGGSFPNFRQVRTSTGGCVSFFNAVKEGRAFNSSRRFSHNWSGTGYVTTFDEGGEELFNTFNLVSYDSIPSPRPFSIDTTLNATSAEWWAPKYINSRQYNRIVKVFYSSSLGRDWNSSGLIENYDPRDHSRSFFVIVNGLAPAGSEAKSFLARYALVSTIFSFLIAGNPNNFSTTSPIQEVPRVEILTPSYGDVFQQGDEIRLRYQVTWQRWDGSKYTSRYPDSFDGGEYVVTIKYQVTGDDTFYYINDDTPVEAGEYPDEDHIFTGGTYVIDTGLKHWRGNYTIRVEAFRKDKTLHYSYHEILIFIK